MTKAMLIDENNALRNELNVLRAAYQAERALNAQRTAVATKPTKPVFQRPQWQIDRAKALQAARELAMQTKQMVVATPLTKHNELPF